MALTATLAACNANPALNGPDGSDVLTISDDQMRLLASFIAQLRDGVRTDNVPMWMTGMIAQFATATAPTGWLKLNGQLVSRTTYATLFAFASAAGLVSEATWSAGSYGCFSVGDGATTFRVPDLRGMHIRGLDESRGIDTGRSLGVFQDHQLLQHNHTTTEAAHQHGGTTDTQGSHAHTINDPTHTHVVPNNVSNTAAVGSGFSVAGNMQVNGDFTTASATGISINANGSHAHNVVTSAAVTGLTINNAGGLEARVKNLAYPFYVKF